jgi:hypothetical protein
MSARVESRRADGRSRSLPQRLHDGAGESANKSAQRASARCRMAMPDGRRGSCDFAQDDS